MIKGNGKELIKEVITIEKLFNLNEIYYVPIYQRPYSWGKEELNDLINYVSEISEENMHFLAKNCNDF